MLRDPGEEKREKIFNATLKLIAENGFHGTAMSRVAKEAGVSAGIIYHYFENKDELIIELYKALKRNWANILIRDFDQTQPLSAQLKYICGNLSGITSVILWSRCFFSSLSLLRTIRRSLRKR